MVVGVQGVTVLYFERLPDGTLVALDGPGNNPFLNVLMGRVSDALEVTESARAHNFGSMDCVYLLSFLCSKNQFIFLKSQKKMNPSGASLKLKL